MGTSATSSQFDQVDVSKNLSQLIRSNTPHYWSYMKHRADLSGLKHYLPFDGMLAGDPHTGNFSVFPLKPVGGSRQMRFVNVDFDDAGRGPFVLDVVRYLVAGEVDKQADQEATVGKELSRRPRGQAVGSTREKYVLS